MTATTRMPALFVGHGSPMNAIEDNRWSRAFLDLAPTLPTPRAILAVSAHWYVRGTYVTAQPNPPTIHDFGGFPRALYEIEYPARGDGTLVSRVHALLGSRGEPRDDWGLDHGTWTVLRYLYPEANVPVVQLSIDARLPPEAHLEIGRSLASLRDEGILLVGSGNVTHNLRHAFQSMHSGDATTPDWAARFDEAVRAATTAHDGAALARLVGTDDGRMAHPTPDHYYPLLYVVGASTEADAVSHPIAGFDLGSLSMRAIRFG